MNRFFIVLIIFAFFISGCSQPCSEISAEYFEQAEEIMDDFLSTVEVADSTSRIALAPMVKEMKDLSNDASDLEVPECAQDVHDHMILFMESITDGFLAFMAQDDESVIDRHFDFAGDEFDNFLEAKLGILEEGQTE